MNSGEIFLGKRNSGGWPFFVHEEKLRLRAKKEVASHFSFGNL